METLVWGCIGLFCFCLILFTKYRSKAKEYDSMVFMKDEYLSKWRDCQEKYHTCQEKYHTCQEEYDRMVSMKDEYLSKWRDCQERYDHLEEQTRVLQKELDEHKTNLQIVMESNLTSIPWLAGMISDFLTLDLEMEARKLDWGNNVQRAKKVASLREIRADVKKRIEEAKEATYQLEYLRKVFPEIDDVITTDYRDLQFSANLSEHDPVRNYLSREEFLKLSEDERNQLALDRYIASRMKSKWQIGRDYELSVAYEYRRKQYDVDTFGSYMGKQDMGRDLIAKKGTQTLIIQCKYWSQSKQIHEKHIFQLYGTVVSYCIEHDIPQDNVKGVFVTNITLSETAKKVASFLHVHYVENHSMIEFPRIKCNVGKDEFGQTHIYHLPMDMQYDATKIEKPGEFYAFTVKQAVNAGFRRAFKWHGG